MAASQVIQAGVGDQGAVIQLQHNQVLTGAGGQAQVPDSKQWLEYGGIFRRKTVDKKASFCSWLTWWPRQLWARSERVRGTPDRDSERTAAVLTNQITSLVTIDQSEVRIRQYGDQSEARVFTWEMELSVMRTHSSRSILSSLWQDRARACETKYDQA